ncbi:hypothetical protein JVT61DRAFT_15514 [Boletus reticuloceps]|uniref:Uncharacterized protein n=1 Tax=Boletus reticuloceps TaxID=495285 RepID=A0A8I2YCI5_9AGAM|nr:hypothetical protein JVT61DRAFT_15514 [Boletus reticuloceps]
MDGEIVREEAELGDYRCKRTKDWMGFKFGGLVECCEKGVANHTAELRIFLYPCTPLTSSLSFVLPHSPFPRRSHNQAFPARIIARMVVWANLVVETQRAVSQVTFSGNPPDTSPLPPQPLDLKLRSPKNLLSNHPSSPLLR